MTKTSGNTYGIDHGVTFNAEDKLRTVLWGWIGEGIPETHLSDLKALKAKISGSEIEELLDTSETLALLERIDYLLTEQVMPSPSPNWPAVPWPVF